MDFIEGSKGVYRPIRVLFDTPIYDRALQLCWNLSSYKTQIALVMEFLQLQQENQIQSQVTAEDMINFLVETSKNTLREKLWEFELEGFDEDEVRPLLKLVWAVNICNKMRDVEFEARMLLNSPDAIPPNFQHPKIACMAKDYAKILTEKHHEAPSSKLLSPQEVVLEVVPRVLQGFWELPKCPLLNMPSQKLSKLSVGVTKAVLDQVSNALTAVDHKATFSRSTRNDMVLAILTNIRQADPLDIVVDRIKNFAPVLLCKIVDVSVEHICELFLPQSPKVPSHLTPTASTAVDADTEKQQAPSEETNSDVASPPATLPIPLAETTSNIQTSEDVTETR